MNTMKIKEYIFITYEGWTLQPNGTKIENKQVIGFQRGIDEVDAFNNLIKCNDYLLSTSFNEVLCLELNSNSYGKFFNIDSKRSVKKFYDRI